MFNIFENPWGLLVAAVAVLLVIWIFRSVTPPKIRWWFWLLPILIAGAAFGIDWLVQTDNEKIEETIYSLVKAVEEQNCSDIALFISSNYHDSFHKTKKQLLANCKARLNTPFIEKAIPRIVSNEQSSPNAVVIFTVRVLFDQQSDISQVYKSDIFFKVQAGLEKQPDRRWLINRIEILEIDRFPAGWQGIQQ
jgi:hypothetical protein